MLGPCRSTSTSAPVAPERSRSWSRPAMSPACGAPNAARRRSHACSRRLPPPARRAQWWAVVAAAAAVPAGNRDPQPDEIEACQGYLLRQVELIRPRVVCTLGNFATKLLSGSPLGITRVHGRPQTCRLGDVEVQLFPIFHPAAALYTPSMLETLRADFMRIPELLAGGGTDDQAPPAPQLVPAHAGAQPEPEPAQLGLF